jgi:Predicted membrane protein (DUF2306)
VYGFNLPTKNKFNYFIIFHFVFLNVRSKIFKLPVTILMYFLFCAGTLLMAKNAMQYVTANTDIGFLKLKQQVVHNTLWLVCFYTHVFTSIVCLALGLVQFSNILIKRNPFWHKLLGKIYVYNILIVNFPTAFIMALYANGFWHTKLAFITLDILWFSFTLVAVIAAKDKNIVKHKNFMIRSFALTFSTITLRCWDHVLVNQFHLAPSISYLYAAWLGFVPNLLFVEFWIWLHYKRLFD